MNRVVTYVCSVLLTLLLTVSILGTAVAGLMQGKALQAKTCTALVTKYNLPQRVYDRLAADYREQENTSGIPASVYMDSLSTGLLATWMTESIEQAFAYLHGTAEDVSISPDFTALEENMTAFFAAYAAENGYATDVTYEKTLASAISAAKKTILTTTDVFRFASLYDANVLPKVRTVLPWVKRACVAGVAATGLLLLLLLWVQCKTLRQVLYWLGCACLCASTLMLVPTIWVTATHWFDRFAVKSDQIFTAVTGYLYGLTNTAIVCGIIGLVLAVLLWVLCAVANSCIAKKAAASTAEHAA